MNILDRKFLIKSLHQIINQEVWLTFEKKVKKKSKTSSLIDYTEIAEIASSTGIFDLKEVQEAVNFLNDLGSLQYFENDSLKDKVIINPQVQTYLLLLLLQYLSHNKMRLIMHYETFVSMRRFLSYNETLIVLLGDKRLIRR